MPSVERGQYRLPATPQSLKRRATVRWVKVMRITQTILALSVAVLSSCSSNEVSADYDENSESGFMDACADSVSDSQLVSNVCGCVYSEVKDNFTYDQMVDLQELTAGVGDNDADGLAAPLADEMRDIVANCVAVEVKQIR